MAQVSENFTFSIHSRESIRRACLESSNIMCRMRWCCWRCLISSCWSLRLNWHGSCARARLTCSLIPLTTRLLPLLTFALAVQTAMIAVGVYGIDSLHSLRFAAARLLVAISLGVIFMSIMFFALPGITLWRSNSLYAMVFAYVLMVTVRALFGKLLGSDGFKRRLLVLGAGPRAARIRSLAAEKGVGFIVVGHVAMNDCEPVIPTAINRVHIDNLAEHATLLNASEVVLALEERRNALPFNDLIRVKTTGVHVNELTSFLERETGTG